MMYNYIPRNPLVVRRQENDVFRNREVILQSHVSPKDRTWVYTSQNVTEWLSKKPQKLKKGRIFIKSFSVSSEEGIKLSKLVMSGNRLTKCESLDNFIHISFGKLIFADEDKQKGTDLAAKYIERLLKTGITLNSISYSFYGHSNSQLQSRSCYLRRTDKTNNFTIFALRNNASASVNFLRLNNLGDFKKINSVSKRAKRIGLLFSSTEWTIKLNPKICKLVKDVEANGEVFTDGCGSILDTFAKEVMSRNENKNRTTPCVFQIRYQGYKGVLVQTTESEIDRIVKSNRSWLGLIFSYFIPRSVAIPRILFRDSMKKFDKCFDQETFCIIGYSKPFTYGKLNGELITLLSTLGIPDHIFLKKLEFYLELIEKCTSEKKKAIEFANFNYRHDISNELRNLNKKFNNIPKTLLERIAKLQKDEKESFYEEGKVKVQILIPDSRLLYGVCDFSGKLKEGECFVKIADISNNYYPKLLTKTLVGRIIVGRNPCLHPGDIRHFQAVDGIKELEHLTDCIVFSVHGNKPAPSLLSGGDLDGDKFFVCWDKDLIPFVTFPPADYSKLQPALKKKLNINQNDMIEYFANYNNFSLGQTKNLYLNWVRGSRLRAKAPQCIQLNALFSKCVDGERINIPHELRKPPKPTTVPFILDVLESEIEKAIPIVEEQEQGDSSDDEEDVVQNPGQNEISGNGGGNDVIFTYAKIILSFIFARVVKPLWKMARNRIRRSSWVNLAIYTCVCFLIIFSIIYPDDVKEPLLKKFSQIMVAVLFKLVYDHYEQQRWHRLTRRSAQNLDKDWVSIVAKFLFVSLAARIFVH